MLDGSGNRVAEYVYGPFGQVVNAAGAMAQSNPFRFSSEYHDDETGLVYYNYRDYSPTLGRWTKRDPVEEEGGVNLYSINDNNPIVSWDHLGHGFADILKHTLLTPSYVGGFFISVLSGDIFWPGKEPNFSDKGCDFLITINGIWNLESARIDLNNKISNLPQYAKISTNNSQHLHNPTTFIGDFVQIAGDEMGLINVTSIRAAKYVNAAGEQAAKNKCGDCFTINVVAHSQGTSVFRNALPLIKEEYKKHIKFIGVGGQRLANFSWGIGDYKNYINGDDIVPISNFLNPLHPLDAVFTLFDKDKSEYHWQGGGWGIGSHPWENNYYQHLK